MSPTLLDRAGAVAADPPDEQVASHYGDPMREQRSLAERVGLVDRSNRGVLAVPGADRLSWLHSLTSQHLERLAAGTGTEALVLSPHGHVEHPLVVADDGGTTWLDVEPGTAGALLTFLDSMRFMLRVEPADVSADWAVLSLVGPQTAEAVDRLGVQLPAQPYGIAPLPSGGFVRAMPWPASAAADLLVPRSSIASVADALAVPPAGRWAYDALRVEQRLPRLGAETDHKTIVQEVGWVPTAVHLDKGCYRGQETVARVHNLGRPPRRLVLLHLDGTAEQLPEHGTPVLAGERSVGFLGTAVRHFELGPIALAMVRRQVADNEPLTVAGIPAAIDTP